MAADRTKSGSPHADVPEVSGRLRPPQTGQMPATLASRLVPVADSIRRLYSTFGIRPYRVFLVHVLWSGQRIGDGSPVEVSRREIEPVPRVTDISATTEVLRPFGLTEEGGLIIDQVSPRYTEDDLMGRTPDLQELDLPRTGLPNAEFFWEVTESRPSEPPSVRRQYKPASVPMLARDGFHWKVILTKTDYDPGRNGSRLRRAF